MDWESLFTNPYFLGASALVGLIMFCAWLLGPLLRWWRRRKLDPQKEIPRLFDALEQVAEQFGIPIRGPLVKNGQPLPPDAAEKLQSIARQLESFAHALVLSAQEYFEFGNAYHALQQFQLAIEKYDKSLALVEHPVTFSNRGVAYDELGQHERAIQDYDKALELKPNDPEALVNRGVAYDALGQHKRAIQDYDKALELKPDFPEGLVNRGNAYACLGDQERAIQDYDRALELKPDYPKALYNRGIAYTELGQHQRAIQDYDRALELKPDYPSPRYNMACVYSLINRPDGAVKWLKEAIDLDEKCRDEAKSDPEFDNIRDDPRFKELVGE